MGTGAPGSPVRRSRSRAGAPIVQEEVSKVANAVVGVGARQRARSKSRPRVLYAPENEIVRASGGLLTIK